VHLLWFYVAQQIENRAVTAININAYKGAWKRISYNIYLKYKALATWYRGTALEFYIFGRHLTIETCVSRGFVRNFM
jgi:hypothetical protein